VIAVLGGLGAALAWATATLCASRSSRLIGAFSVLAWVMVSGLVLNLGLIALHPRPTGIDGPALGWMAVAGAGNVVGLLLSYSALRRGKVGLVAPITSTEGAVAAVVAVAAGEPLGVSSGLLLAVVAAGVALAAAAPERRPVPGEQKSAAVLFAVGAAVSFGLGLYATGHLSSTLALGWTLLPPRLTGVVLVTVPLAVTGRLRLTRGSLPLVLVGGAAEVVGFASYASGARHDIAVAAVLASQFAAIAAVVAFVLFRERLTRLQVSGVTIVLAGVAVLSAVRA
jgi:drug/metabolite transporter (DMT)-like permease